MFVFMIGREVIVGLIIGFAASLLFMAFKLAGTIIGFQMGFSIVSVIDPQSNQQISIIGQLQYLAAILLFLAIDGHHFLLEALAQSFQVIPLNGAAFSGRLVEKFVSMSAQVFVIAIKIGLPVIIALLMTTVALGVIARTAPQMNVFIVGFPLKIGLGIFMLATSFPLLAYMFKKLMLIFKNDVITTIRLLAP